MFNEKKEIYSTKTELPRIISTVIANAIEITTDNISTAQDAMIELRLVWETLQSTLRNRKVDGFEVVVSNMKDLAAVAITMASVLEAKILTQRQEQMGIEEEDIHFDEIKEEPPKKIVKSRKKKKKTKLQTK